MWLRILLVVLLAGLAFVLMRAQAKPDLADFRVDPGISPSVARTIIQFPDSTEFALAIFDGAGDPSFYGCRRSKDSVEAVKNQDHLFQIGSLTKLFTATSLVKILKKHGLQLDDAINDHYDFPFKDELRLTFRALANHTSGLPRMPSNLRPKTLADPYAGYDGAALETYLRDDLTVGDTTYEYSNLGAGLLGYTLAKIEGKTYAELIQDLISDPLGMPATVQYPGTDLRPLIVTPRGTTGQRVLPWQMDALAGAGALYSTTHDLATFVAAHFNDEAHPDLALTRRTTLTVDPRLSMGLGWHIRTRPEQLSWYWHNGGVAGYSSMLAFEPTSRRAVILLSNVSAFHRKRGELDVLVVELMREMLSD